MVVNLTRNQTPLLDMNQKLMERVPRRMKKGRVCAPSVPVTGLGGVGEIARLTLFCLNGRIEPKQL
jgi:hypothetical protein